MPRKPPLPHISRVLAEQLFKRGWTGYHLAQVSGVSQPAVSRLLRGERTGNVAFRTVAALARALGVSLDVFLEADGAA